MGEIQLLRLVCLTEEDCSCFFCLSVVATRGVRPANLGPKASPSTSIGGGDRGSLSACRGAAATGHMALVTPGAHQTIRRGLKGGASPRPQREREPERQPWRNVAINLSLCFDPPRNALREGPQAPAGKTPNLKFVPLPLPWNPLVKTNLCYPKCRSPILLCIGPSSPLGCYTVCLSVWSRADINRGCR